MVFILAGMADRDIILELGGPAELCRKLGFDPKAGGTQRVQNWMTRGIPDSVRLEHYELFKQAEEAVAAARMAGRDAS